MFPDTRGEESQWLSSTEITNPKKITLIKFSFTLSQHPEICQGQRIVFFLHKVHFPPILSPFGLRFPHHSSHPSYARGPPVRNRPWWQVCPAGEFSLKCQSLSWSRYVYSLPSCRWSLCTAVNGARHWSLTQTHKPDISSVHNVRPSVNCNPPRLSFRFHDQQSCVHLSYPLLYLSAS